MRKTRKLWLIVLIAAAAAVTAGIIGRNAFGKFVPEEPYVARDSRGNDVDPESAQVVVTSEGSNQKGKEGSGNSPCSKEVPTCVGKKGSETNPFIVLEVVPSHDQQQLCYFAGDEESGLPFDPQELGRKVLPEGRSYASGQSANDLGITASFGARWLTQTPYQVYDIGSMDPDDRKKIHLAEIGKYYTLEYSEDDIREKAQEEGKDPEQELKKFSDSYNNGNGTIEQMYKACPYLFQTDTTEQEVSIEKKAIEDDRNWKKQKSKPGYLVVKEQGKGDFTFDGYNIRKDSNDRWSFSTEKPSGRDLNKELQLWQIGDEINKDTADRYVGDYFKLSDVNFYIPDDLRRFFDGAEEEYSLTYYGLKFNDVLKQSLFSFSSKKEYEDFHMKVICMTPDELNQISEKDSDDTVDMVERADMFFIQCGYPFYPFNETKVEGTEETVRIYHKWALGEDDFVYREEKNRVTFFDTDMEWDSVMKILKRVSENRNLPLLFNMPVGTMLNIGAQQKENEEDVCMYVTSESSETSHMHKEGSLNNIAKLYLITAQFDLLARKANGYTQTFMEDIYPALQKIQLNGKNAGTVKTTGYYKRKEAVECPVKGHSDVSYRNRANYLWNPCTFYPETVPWNKNGFSKGDEWTKQFMQYGFLESYLTDVNSNPFAGRLSQQARGASADELRDGAEKNVAVVGAAVADTNESTFLHPNRDSDPVVSEYLGVVAHTILNAETDTVENLTVTVLPQKKEYVKVADTSILLDHSSDRDYGDETSYVKVQVNCNGNNLPGVITKIVLKKDGREKTLKLYKTKECSDADLCARDKYKDSNTHDYYEGYTVDGSLIAYIPYSLKDWADGFTTIGVTTVGRIHNSRKKQDVAGDPFTTDISIGERTLFNLE